MDGMTRWELEQQLGIGNDEMEVWVEHNGDLFPISMVRLQKMKMPDRKVVVLVADEE